MDSRLQHQHTVLPRFLAKIPIYQRIVIYMKKIAVVLISLILLGCEATPVQNASQVKTKSKLNPDIQLPLDVSVAYYVDKSKPDRKINFYGKLEEAAELVVKDFF